MVKNRVICATSGRSDGDMCYSCWINVCIIIICVLKITIRMEFRYHRLAIGSEFGKGVGNTGLVWSFGLFK